MNIHTLTIHSEDKKTRIMASTIELVAENGIHATPMSKVSKRANVAAGTIYHYFENKEALIRETFFTIKSMHIDIMREHVDLQQSFQSQFFVIWKQMYQCLLIPGHLSFIEQCGLSPLIDEKIVQRLEEMAEPMIEFFRHGKQQQAIKRMPNRLLFQLIFGSIASLAKIKMGNRLTVTDALIDEAMHFCWDGIKCP